MSIIDAIDQRRLKDAIDRLKTMAKSLTRSDLIDELYGIETTYRSMLRYNLEGVADPSRDSFYLQIVSSLYALADKVSDLLLQQHTGLHIYSIRKELANTSLSQVLEEYEEAVDVLELKRLTHPEDSGGIEYYNSQLKVFNYLWSVELSTGDYNLITPLFESSKVAWQDKALFVSAIWLSMANRFCALRASLLIKLCVHPDVRVACRARVSLLLSLFQHGNRWDIDQKLKSQLSTLMGQKNMEELMFQTLVNIVRTRETDLIAKKMREKILPELLKAQPTIREKLNLDNLLGDKFTEGKNPDWEDMFSNEPEFLSKLEEITKWQMEGADVFMSTFKGLKHYPFFNNVANWFLPYYANQPQLVEAIKNEPDVFKKGDLISSLSETTLLCNSDKYSFMLSITQLPPSQKEMMSSMYSSELGQMKEIRDDEQLTSPFKKEGMLANQYIQDLYRFFKVFPRHREFEDIFNSIFDVQNKWFFGLVVPDRGRKVQLAEFFFNKDFYTDAISIYEHLQGTGDDDIAIIQKIAYCHQQNGEWDKALKSYMHADLLSGNNHWTKKKIALCYLKQGNVNKALEYYHIAEKLQPDNLHTKVSIANCYLDLKNFDAALKYFFEVEYLEPGNTNVRRPIAWCCFVAGKFDQAEKYYQKVIADGESKHDLLNLSHVYWCSNRRKDAVNSYGKALAMFDSKEAFLEAFHADEEYLIANGVAEEDLPIMVDQVFYIAD